MQKDLMPFGVLDQAYGIFFNNILIFSKNSFLYSLYFLFSAKVRNYVIIVAFF